MQTIQHAATKVEKATTLAAGGSVVQNQAASTTWMTSRIARMNPVAEFLGD